ncbi:MAG: EMC3/TMCO1 family protein [Candidatus Diapherotrites archaeon]|nr:EMC3/TMCO1 family protein [Candidatus Diapherotrites archaeon]
MHFISPAIDIVLISAVLVAASRLLERRFVDKKKMKESQQRMKEKQKQIKDLMQRSDEKSKQDATRMQQEMLQEMSENMQGSLNYMMVSLPVFLVAFFFLGQLYGGKIFEAPFPLPQFHGFSIINPFSWVPVGIGTETGYLRWYFISYLIISILLGIAMKIASRVRTGGAGEVTSDAK